MVSLVGFAAARIWSSRSHCAPPPTRSPAPLEARPHSTLLHRSAPVGMALPAMAAVSKLLQHAPKESGRQVAHRPEQPNRDHPGSTYVAPSSCCIAIGDFLPT
jgi:hypothetical protein